MSAQRSDQLANTRQAADAVTSVESLRRAADAPALQHGAQGEPSGSRACEGAAAARDGQRRRVLDFVPLEPFHVKQVAAEKTVKVMKGDLTEADIAIMCPGALALLADGAPVACGGLLDEKMGRARAWALIGESMPYSAWKPLIERMRGVVEEALADGFHRVWAETVYDWAEGHKLLLHLGMEYEGTNRGTFGPERHGVTYARVRGDVAPLPIRVRCMNLTAERCLWEDSMSQAVPWAIEEARRNARRAA